MSQSADLQHNIVPRSTVVSIDSGVDMAFVSALRLGNDTSDGDDVIIISKFAEEESAITVVVVIVAAVPTAVAIVDIVAHCSESI